MIIKTSQNFVMEPNYYQFSQNHSLFHYIEFSIECYNFLILNVLFIRHEFYLELPANYIICI